MTELITYVFEIIATCISFYATALLIKKSRNSQVPLGTRLLATGMFLLGIYTLTTIIYSLIATEWAIIFFMKLGMISVMVSVLSLFYTMQVLIYSSSRFKTKNKSFWAVLVITIIIASVLAFTNYIVVIDAATAETHFEPIPFYLFAAYVAGVVIYSAISMYTLG